MRKVLVLKLLLLLYSVIFVTSIYANGLLQSPATGSLSTVFFNRFCMVSNATDAVLVVAGDNNALYAIDIADNKTSDAAANLISSVANFASSKLNAAAGQTVTVTDMAVNPISKTVYVLGKNAAGTTSYIFKITAAGNTVTLLNLNSIKHSKLNWNGTANFLDLAWGNNTLYISESDVTSLNGDLGWIGAPFVHNATITKRATSMYKSNWGTTYYTDAPLETMTYGSVSGKHRLLGVTTCAPGFSLDASTISGSGVLQVTEDFNVNQGTSTKVVFLRHDSKDWLFDLHEGFLYRIAGKYLDGSPVTANKHNQNAALLRDGSENPAPGMTDAEIKKYTGKYEVIARWDDYRLLVLETAATGGALKLMQVSSTAPPSGIGQYEGNLERVTFYPNPAKQKLTLTIEDDLIGAQLIIFSLDGKSVLNERLVSKTTTINIASLPAGDYKAVFSNKDGRSIVKSLNVQ